MEQKYPLTNPQKSIYYTEIAYKGTPISNISGILNIKQKLNFEILEKAVNKMIEENDALRLKIKLTESGEPIQYIEDFEYINSELVDITEENLKVLAEKLCKTPFKEEDKYLFKFLRFRLPNGQGGCIITHSHLISDAWTSALVSSQVVDYYIEYIEGRETQKNNPSYIEYIKEEEKYINSEKYKKDKEYFENKYAHLEKIDTIGRNIENTLNSAANRVSYQLSEDYSSKIMEYCADCHISVYTFFITVYAIYISRVIQLEKITFGTPILNRKNVKEKNTMGMFVSTIPIDIDLSHNENIVEIFKKTAKEILTLMRHQRYPYIELLKYIRERFGTNRGLYGVIISYQNAKTKSTQVGIPYTAEWTFNGNISEALNIHIADMDNTNKINLFYDYKIDIISETDIKNMHNRIIYIINQILENKELMLDNIDIVPENEKKIIEQINKNSEAKYEEKTIYQLFEDQVEKNPNNIAVKINNQKLTYKELNEKANSLARILIQKGVKKDIPVGIRINKSLEMTIGILGIIKAGGCYLPINLMYPEERVSFMLKDSNAKLLLTNTKSNDMNLNAEIINLDEDELYKADNSNLEVENSIDDLLYIIYTSGSTGVPKGVMITHRNVVRLMKNDKFLFDFSEKDVWTMFHSVAFDFSVWEMYGALLYGGKLILVPEETATNPKEFLSLMRKEKVTILNQTPTFFYNLLEQELKNEDNQLKVRYIIFGGEALKPNLIKNWKEKYPKTKLINMYGITETCVHVTYKELNEVDLLSGESIVGCPIPTLKTYILDKKQRMLPIGIEGEICVAGAGLARGYLNRPELTKEKFIKNPYEKKEKLYRSADSAYIGNDGNLYYIGRIDNQVKIRGFRVELGEIESKLLKHPSVSKCVVLEEKTSEKDSHLVAYIVCKNNVKIEELKKYMQKIVPAYMVPSYFVKLKDIPVNHNGKADRSFLKTIKYTIEKENEYIAPRNEFEEILQNIIQDEMNIKEIGIDDDILNLGADSLTLMRIVSKLLDKGYEISIQKFYEQKTIRNINDTRNSENEDVNSISNNIYFDFKEIYPQEKNIINNVLLTGVTGFLGIHILNDLIENTNTKIYCLIRDKNGIDAKTRLKNKIKFYFNNSLLKELDKRIIVVKGDIAKEKLGLNDEKYKELGYKIDTVVHSAAQASHYGEKEDFERANIIGTNNMIEFCKTFKAKLNHISTISVCADFVSSKKIKEVFNEHALYIGQSYKKNIYVRTKFEAEYNIWKEAKNGLNFTIYRMGNITSRTTDGKFQENDYQNAFLNRMLSFIKIGKVTEDFLKHEFDMSPVDICSKFIAQTMQYQASNNRIIHLENNNKLNLEEIIQKLKIHDLEVVSKEEFIEAVKANKDRMGLINDITNKLILTKNIEINSDLSVEYLRKLKLSWPKIEEKYIEKYLDIMEKEE